MQPILHNRDKIPSYLPVPKQQILDSSKHKEFADDNFKFDEKGRKLSERVENTVEMGEIARYVQFLLFLHCFQKTYSVDTEKLGLVWERVRSRPAEPVDDHTRKVNWLNGISTEFH